MNMKRIILTIIIACTVTLASVAQMDRRVQNKPYIDLRQLHFGILIGLNMQDIEFENVGLQTITDEDGADCSHYLDASAQLDRILIVPGNNTVWGEIPSGGNPIIIKWYDLVVGVI